MWQAVVGSAVVGGLMQNRAAKKQAAAMNAQAAAQVEAARIAAEEQRFRPVGITTRFGSATPQFTDNRLTGYDYQGSPEVTALQDQLSRIYGSSLGQAEQAAGYQPQFQQAAEGLFALGQQEMPQSREQIMAEQQALLRPYDIEEEQRLAAGVFGRGRGGLSVGAGGQPELQALAEARSRRDQQLLANVDQAYLNRAASGANLFGQGAGLLGQGYTTQQAALAPFTSQFSTAQGLEQAAQQPMDIGTALGQKVTTANTNAANTMLAGQSAAGNLQRQAATAQAQQMAGMGQGISNLGTMYGMGMFSPTATPATTSVNSPAEVYAFQQQMGMAPKG
ncbi:hypothetical protein N9Z85_06590 [Akkermansiaceae bacterium]|nr:hypothetical protein [Akkermansiaceae bacterium]